MSEPKNVRIYVSEKDLSWRAREYDQHFQRIHHRLSVKNAKELVESILSVLKPGQYIEYLYIDGHGEWEDEKGTSVVGMAIGPKSSALSYKLHTIRPGETLSGLALRYYGNGNRWRAIYERNRDRIGPDPNRIMAGDKVIIPNLPPIEHVEELRRLRSRFAAGASVFLGGCRVGKNAELIKELSGLWGVHVRAGLADQWSLPGAEGRVLHCFIRKCNVEPHTFWGVREGP
ncbi:MAG: LysM peptidoglycan-binding domain-containing protein [bacterium]|nr:MAG: LysM peptidoglycan-binding domain-containing protein [bacterium]